MLQDSRVVCELYLLGQDLDFGLKDSRVICELLSFRSRPGLLVKGGSTRTPMVVYQLLVGQDLKSWFKGKDYQDSMVLYQLHILGRDLDSWLKEEGIPGLQGIDTRALTKVEPE